MSHFMRFDDGALATFSLEDREGEGRAQADGGASLGERFFTRIAKACSSRRSRRRLGFGRATPGQAA
jgi:hypothetical protein